MQTCSGGATARLSRLDVAEKALLDCRAMTGIPLSADSDGFAPLPPMRPLRITPRIRRRTLVALAVVALAALLAFNVGREVYASWAIGQDADALARQVAAAEAENAALRLQLEYVQSDAYVTQEARRLSDVGEPGEQVLIIPNGATRPSAASATTPEAPRPLLQQWWDLFFGD